ncbi:MAG: hypothetical protein GWN71_34355, partial [Gammaproteobacteria bacterium]|nr:hypothetical protein [Gammaproteobacteria bacterium]
MSERMLKPTQWRKASGLPGNAPKDDVGVRARELLSDRDVVTQDSADALLIALAGQRINAET